MHDPFADLVGLKPVVKPSVPIKNVGSSSGLSATGGATVHLLECIMSGGLSTHWHCLTFP